MKLNPNGVVPTLVHDGNVICESSLILYYIDEAFPNPPLMPTTPVARHRVRLYNKVIEPGLESEFVIDALHQHQKMISWMAEDLNKGPYLAGDAFSNADCAVIP